MIALRDPSMADRVADPWLREHITQRFTEMCPDDDFEDYDPDINGFMIVVEPGDTVEQLESEADCPVLGDPWDDTRFGDPDFTPSFEVLEEHDRFYELVLVPDCGDFGVVIFIPKYTGIDPALLSFCSRYATPAPVVQHHL